MKDRDSKDDVRAPQEWKAPTLMVFEVKGRTKNFTVPAPNHDSSTNYYTSVS